MSTGLNTLGSSLALHEIGDLADLLNERPKDITGYIEIDIDLIDEDPTQPRTEKNPGFSKQSIAELAESILNTGLLQPITIRKHPEIDGRFMIKDGARRFRASKQNKAEKIAAIIEDEGQKTAARVKIEQLIVNLQKEGNTPDEIAKTIAIALDEGIPKKTIAALTGKSPAWVTLHTTLLELPEHLDLAYKSGKVTDVNIIYELTKLYKTNKNEVIAWLDTPGQEYTRGQLKLFQEYLKDKKEQEKINDDAINHTVEASESTTPIDDQSGNKDTIIDQEGIDITNADTGENKPQVNTSSSNDKKISPTTDKLKKTIVIVKHDDRAARILLDHRPSASGYAWLKYEDDGHIFESQLSDVTLLELIEG